jgi:hypothetical protein
MLIGTHEDDMIKLTALLALLLTANANARGVADEVERYFPENPPPGYFRPKMAPIADWTQPPLGCVEEMIPNVSSHPCLDLSLVTSPLKDWPANLPPGEVYFWYGHRRNLSYCRAAELLKREAAAPGSQSFGAVTSSWMQAEAVKNYDQKVAAVYEASERYGIPAHVLAGAIYQESLFAELGISNDGGNFSCGVEQINITGWCGWANNQSAADKIVMAWPLYQVDCNDSSIVAPKHLRPFFEIAKTRLNGLPEYRLRQEHFQNIALADVQAQWTPADDVTFGLRYQVARSFIDNCSNPHYGIMAKANELFSLYSQSLSSAFKHKDRYLGTERFQRRCMQTARDNAYPLHTGWLMAVASYNAGPRAIDAVTYYNVWDRAAFNDPATVASFTPSDLVTSLYWGGKYNPVTDKIDFIATDGSTKSWIWFKGCVAQRHVARVMQHMTLLPEFFVDSLEGAFPCATSSVDANGNIVTSVPPARQASSGVKQ